MMNQPHPESDARPAADHDAPRPAYETPSVHDLGSLTGLTLSGNGPLSDGFGNSSGGS